VLCSPKVISGLPATNELIVGGGGVFTVTVTDAATDPEAFVADSVYTVVVLGLTTTLVPLTGPRPEMLKPAAPVMLQDKVVLCPDIRLEGLAVKRSITGRTSVTTARAVTLPVALLAVRM
jgi:hypothetical protein